MAIKNPPPIPLLHNLATTPGAKQEVEELKQFLFLLWNSLGGGSDLVSDSTEQSSRRLSSSVRDAKKQLDQALAYIYTSRGSASQGETDSLKAEILTQSRKIRNLESRIDQLTALVETNG